MNQPIPIPRQGHKRFWILLGIIILIIVLTGLYFLLVRGVGEAEEMVIEEEVEIIETPLDKIDELEREMEIIENQELGIGIKIKEFGLVHTIDENYDFVKRYNQGYAKDEEIIIFHRIDNIDPLEINGKYYLDFSETVELLDPYYNNVGWFENLYSFKVEKEVEENNYHTMPVIMRISPKDLKETGEYILTITVENDNYPQRDEKEIRFMII